MHFNESKWKNMTEQELEVFKKEVFDHYRKNGFPYYNDDLEKQKKSIKKMDEYFKTHEVIKNDVIRQTMHCLSTAWTYFPHAWGIKGNRMNTPMEIGSEEFALEEPVDLVFTSPPYFDNEIYSDEETQSCNRYPKYEDWRYNYLYRTMISMPSSVKKGGDLIINIANTKRAPTLVKDFTDWIDMLGYFKLEKELKLALSSISHKDQFKYEPVFVYKKL